MCNKLKCTRCHYEELKGTENYCPICGFALSRTALEKFAQEQSEAINNGLKTLNQVRKEFCLEPIEGGDILYHKRIL